jgi:hypothetical protein
MVARSDHKSQFLRLELQQLLSFSSGSGRKISKNSSIPATTCREISDTVDIHMIIFH